MKKNNEFDEVNKLIKLYWGYYQDSSPSMQRFIKYSGWIAIQFWIFRAPLTWYMVQVLPETMLNIPSYIIADFTAGLIMAIAGFFVSEYKIWGGHGDVQE